MASKYLELARAPQKAFDGTIAPYGLDGQPYFVDLEELVQRERFERKLLEAVPDARPEQPAAWESAPFPPMVSYESRHAQEASEDEAALACIDLMLYFGIAGLVPFTTIQAAQAYGFLSPQTVASERVQLQLVKALMLQGRWLDAITFLEKLLAPCDRLRSAHLLLGECQYRAAKESELDKAGGVEGTMEFYTKARSSFETALDFVPDPKASVNCAVPGDDVVHFRLASIHFAYAAAADFKDEGSLSSAMLHYKRSLLISPTAEVWLCAGICAYRQACLGRQRSLFRCKEPAPEYQSGDPDQVRKRQNAFKEASQYLTEANLLDATRPQTNAWLVICAVEMANVQIAKQTLRQVLRYDTRLDAATCLELAVVLLRCSDESRAGPGERKWIAQNGRYAAEAIMVANLLASFSDCGEVHYILGLAHILNGNDGAALPELQAAVPWFNHDTPCQDEINNVICLCSGRLNANSGNAIKPITVAPAPPRTVAQKSEFHQRLADTRAGGDPKGKADFANWESGVEIYDHDLPQILEAVAEGDIIALSLRGARLGAWGINEIVVRIRESVGYLQEVDVSCCAAVGQLGKELVNNYPYKRGVSMEASGTGLPEEDVVLLRNRNEDSEKVLRRMAQEQQRSIMLCEEYKSRQDILEQLGLEESNSAVAPEQPKAAYCPSRWVQGIELRAQQAYQDFIAANKRWGVSGIDFHDVLTEVPTIFAKSGETISLDDIDVNTVLQQKRIDMLQQEGYVTMEKQQDFREDEMEEDAEEPRLMPTLSQVPPPLYANIFGPDLDGDSTVLQNRRLIGFMVYLGVRASPDEVAIARQDREDQEAEEAERVEREQRMQEERREREARERAEWEALHKKRVEVRNDLSKRAKAQYDNGSKALPKGIGSGQIIAHLTYICLDMDAKLGNPLKPPSLFGLNALSEAPRPKPRRGHDLHEALFTGKVVIEEATGSSFGNGALTLKLRSLASEPMEVAVRRGSIFQHTDWVHKQNLLVAIDYLVTIPAGDLVEKSMKAYCMNQSCSCSSGEFMELTEFYFDTSHVLDSQGNVWDHFESCFGHR